MHSMRVAALRVGIVAMLAACAAPPHPIDVTPVRRQAATVAPVAVPDGYVDDARCADCHAQLFASYQGVGMAQSMTRPRRETVIERLDEPFFHARSNRWYAMSWSDDQLLFRRWQIAEDGSRIHELELPVAWIVGSGYRSRVYLHRNAAGELYQLPLAWYPQENAWGMAPGYDRADHEGVERMVRRECVFCHNAYPAHANGSDARWAPQTFPDSMPEGTGCQRCHGPGAAHVDAVGQGEALDAIRRAIVNPKRLEPRLRDDVCFQCHMLPAVELTGIRRLDRGDYSFRPGELLREYLLHVDIDERSRAREERFEINHHAYRLTQSACYQQGGITCIDCHDPHQPLRSDPRVARANDVCLRCHDAHEVAAANTSCVSCHMPRRRTQDVVHVTMTDHRIGIAPSGDLLAPLDERAPDIRGFSLVDPDALPGEEGEIYRALTMLRANRQHVAARAWLERVLPQSAIASPVPLMDLIAAELQQRRFAEAEHFIAMLPERERSSPLVLGWSGIAKVGLGRTETALVDLRRAAAAAPDSPDAQFNLGLVLHRNGAHAEALPLLTRALELRPTLVAALRARAEVFERLGRLEEAARDRERALAIRPAVSGERAAPRE